MKKAVIYFEPPASEIDEMRRILSEADVELTVQSGFDKLGSKAATPEALIDTVDGVHAALLGGEMFDEAVITAASKLQVISRIGVGFDRVDLEAARSRGIPVVVAAGSNHVTVAEFACGLILALSRGIVRGHNAALAGEWVDAEFMVCRAVYERRCAEACR
jgi:phosphoglycerate dehydrogenase-like enzyme